MAEPTLTTTAIARPTNRAVAVLLNEAALDSPTFRSTALHFGDQIDTTEKWLGGYVSSTLKLVHDFAALDDTINSYLTKTSPLASDTLLDNDYTRLGLKRVNDGSREVLTQMLTSMKRMESTVVDPIRSFLTGDLRNFKEIRRTLEQSQRTYDSTLSRYVSQHKTKEPSALREDAFSVYESRKAYILASMDYCQLVPQIRSTLDRLLVKVSSELWKEMKGSRDAATNATRYTREMDRIKGWARGMEYAESVFTKELQAARRTLSDSTLERFKPSRELDDYSTSTVPFLSSRGPVNMKPAHQGIVISEKQGYLFLRVATSKPVKYSWVRRWHYCSDGVFGWLIPGAQGVLQGDEIGVLLCNARPAVGEERRFCFEVKTKDQTMVLQAESQTELTEWLEVFEVTKKRAFEASASRDAASLSGNDPAFSITPASAPEFSANYIDTQLHSVDEPPAGLERSGTLGIPGEGTLGVRPTYDAAGTVNRRSFSALSKDISRDESETSRDHAARIMQKLDLHRKSPDAGAGGIASLINASAAVLPAYPHPFLSPHTAKKLPSALPNIDSSRLGLLAPPTLAKPPASTNLSKTAVLLASERGPISDSRKKLPTSIVANYWGSNVWASINTPVQPVLPRLDDDDPIGVVLPEGMHASLSISSDDRKPSEVFPNNYPPELKAQHAQFRLLFPDAPPDDKLVLVFRASWSSATPQNPDDYTLAGNGRVYVTQENMYFYGQQMGLVTAYSISLDIITEVAAAAGRDCDSINLHLGEDTNETGYTQIRLKLYLDDLYLLQGRLNLIIDNLQAEEPTDTYTLIAALINLEKAEFDKPSPSVDSWEDVSPSTPADGTYSSRRDLSRSYDSTPHLRRTQSRQKLIPKIQLPSHPVIFEPEDMKEMAAERHFEISAKACFHVLFGDKSFVFPKLYFEHRAKQITQGPWILVDQGKMRRDFQFKVEYADMLGRSKTANVNDYQTIDTFNDHVSYVVTHMKTAWHLPHSRSFKLMTKVVITHVAKSKCKLAIYVKIDWSKAPALSKNMVERQALRDIVSDAEELAELATDQVRKLGSRSRTSRAIQVYGHVGQQTQVVVFSPGSSDSGKKQAIKPRTLTSMIFDTVRSFGESAITSVIMWIFAAIKTIFGVITGHRLLVVLLVVSGLLNLLLGSTETSTWWKERRAAKFMRKIGVGPNAMMSKALYISDLDTAYGTDGSSVLMQRNSTCFKSFKDIFAATDMDAPWEDAGAALTLPTSRATAQRLRHTRQRLGAYRHDLVVAMRIVNSMDREMMQSEWKNWVMNENAHCDNLKAALSSSAPVKRRGVEWEAQKILNAMPADRKKAVEDWHNEYCQSCSEDFSEVVLGNKGSV
ncbi:hypothetical protein VHEMI05111 [[Torrubiella] hemipterigena]|uniref:Transcription factor SipA3 n=1 Tax=[Torrubiella] hemipterigena TaxID=1531966 RepID=A0A0A1THY6_9HYPO|nr:hypothetical protein VHEMI05111 [[Torrubiella] hemipterigena]